VPVSSLPAPEMSSPRYSPLPLPPPPASYEPNNVNYQQQNQQLHQQQQQQQHELQHQNQQQQQQQSLTMKSNVSRQFLGQTVSAQQVQGQSVVLTILIVIKTI